MEAPSSRSPPTSTSEFSFETADLIEILEDLSTRFILNLPESESESIPRLCFQVEQAYWFYEDWVRDSQPNLPSYTLKRFSEIFFKVCPMLEKWSDKHERLFLEFMRYKSRVPVCGAIMINEGWDKCILVKGWKGNSWSFPKGKINQDEEKHICAIREVSEETGCDLINLLKTDEDYFHETTIQDQRITLYFVPGVPDDFIFETQTRKEIGAIEWFKLSDLPTWRKSKTTSTPKLAGKGKFYMILPFVPELKKFVKSHRPSGLRRGSPNPTPTPESALPTSLDEDPPSETELSTSEPISESPAALREAPVPLSELDELFARFLSSGEMKDSRSSSVAPRQESIEEGDEDENEGTVMGASDAVEDVKPPPRSILDEMFGALTMPTIARSPAPSNQFSPPPHPSHPQILHHLSQPQPQPQQSSSLLSLFSNLPPTPPQQIVYQSGQLRPPPNASLLALLNPSIPSPALHNPSPMYHQHSAGSSAPLASAGPSTRQPTHPSLTNDKQSLLAMFSPPPSRSVPSGPPPSSSSTTSTSGGSEAERKKQKQQALLAMMDASLSGPGAGGTPPDAFNGQSPMVPQQQPAGYNSSSPYVSHQSHMMHPPPPNSFPLQPPAFPPQNGFHPPPLPNLNGPQVFPPPSDRSSLLPHPHPSLVGPGPGGFPVQSPLMLNGPSPPGGFPLASGPPPPPPPPPGAPFQNGVPSYPGPMPMLNGHGRPLPLPGFNPSNGLPPPPFADNAFRPPLPPQGYRGQPFLPPNGPYNNQQQAPFNGQQPRDPFTVNPNIQLNKIASPNGMNPAVISPMPKAMTNHAESLLGMLKGGGGGGGAGGRVASVGQPGYPSGSPAPGRA